jgi:hypothetical protein
MSVWATSAVLSQAASGAPAGIQAWTGEIFNALVNECGLTQTNDTGQLTYSGGNTNATQPTGTGVSNAVGHMLFTWNDALARGTLSATALNSGGSGYTNGTNTPVTVTGTTSGATCSATCTVTGGVAANLASISASGNFIVGEKLTVTGIGAGTGANWTATVLSSGSPVVLRLDFGAGSAVTDPQMWATVGTGTNGAGVINGSAGTTAMTQVACFTGAAPASTSTAYNSYYCYNSTYGFLKIVFKTGATAANITFGQLYVFRSNSTAGAANGAGVMLIANSVSTTGATAVQNTGNMQCATYGSGVFTSISPSSLTVANCGCWPALQTGATTTIPFGLTSTLQNGVITIPPAYYFVSGQLSFSAFIGVGLVADLSIGSTVSMAIIGATQLTFQMDAEGFNAAAIGQISSTVLGVVSLYE